MADDQLSLDIGGAPTPPVRGKKRPDGGRSPARERGAPSSPERPAPPKRESLGRGASPAATSPVPSEDGLAASPENEGPGVHGRSSEEASPGSPLDCARDLLCMTCYRWTQVIEPQGPFTDTYTYKCGECLEGKWPRK